MNHRSTRCTVDSQSPVTLRTRGSAFCIRAVLGAFILSLLASEILNAQDSRPEPVWVLRDSDDSANFVQHAGYSLQSADSSASLSFAAQTPGLENSRKRYAGRSIGIEWLYLRPRTTFGEVNLNVDGQTSAHEYTFRNDSGVRVFLTGPLNDANESWTLSGTTFLADSNSGFLTSSTFTLEQSIGGINVTSPTLNGGGAVFDRDFLYHGIEGTWNRAFNWSDTTGMLLSAGVRASSIEQQRMIALGSSNSHRLIFQFLNSTFRGLGPILSARIEHHVTNGIYAWLTPTVGMLLGRHEYRESRTVFTTQTTDYQLLPVFEFRGGIGRDWETNFGLVSVTGGYQMTTFHGLVPLIQDRPTLARDPGLSGLFVGVTLSR